MMGDFNMSCLKYHKNTKTKHVFDNIFEKSAIPIINRKIKPIIQNCYVSIKQILSGLGKCYERSNLKIKNKIKSPAPRN